MKERHCVPINTALLYEEMLTNLDTAKSKQILLISFIYLSLQFVASIFKDKDERNKESATLIHKPCFFCGIDLFMNS